ncbi:RagB/SusD family nutrient uptake outer membrane protein [Sphingobacterium suaedae]|uniref:RagB/SusD family nutrient uptake outer membrane protein n=1 Tax=Sphingobacterium suaedae TaxID=1686402 RepID=A0ABW5KKN6_9SPHI
MKKINIYILVGIFLGTVYSCKDFLEEVPRNSTYVGEFWQSEADVNSALAGNYALLRNALSSGNFENVPRHYLYSDGVPSTYFTIQYSGDGLEGVQTGDFTWRYTIESYGDWTRYYKTIIMSNLIIEKVAAMDDALFVNESNPSRFKNEAIGQAYFIRALTYFMLTRVWGDVPLVLTTSSDPIAEEQVGRVPKAEILAQVEKDCHQAAELLDWGYRNQDAAKVTANKGSVYALLAHLYLWRATTTDLSTTTPIASDVHSADTTIAALKSFGGYAQVDTSNYYSTFIGKSREGIFELAASEQNLEGSSAHIATFFLRQAQISYYNPTYSRFFVPKNYLTTHFSRQVIGWGWVLNSSNQWEWKEHVAAVGETIYDEDGSNGRVVTEDMLIDNMDVRLRKNFTDISLSQPTCIKYSNVNYRTQSSAFISNNTLIFRYSDMLLLEAEIALYKGNITKAISIINGFRTRNGSSSLISGGATKEEVFYQYALERGKELFLEGHIYYDLIRTRQYAEFIPWLSPQRFMQGGFYWPVSPLLFKNNSFLAQTSYWVGKV